MSRRCAFLLFACSIAGAALCAPANAQSVQVDAQSEPATDSAPNGNASEQTAASDRAIAQRMLVSPTGKSPRKRCGEAAPNGEIVVCAVDNSQFRVQSTSQSDPSSKEALDDGRLHPPNVSGLPDCSRGCVGMGKVPPPAYMIDLASIPEAPADSEADKIAKGEMRDR